MIAWKRGHTPDRSSPSGYSVGGVGMARVSRILESIPKPELVKWQTTGRIARIKRALEDADRFELGKMGAYEYCKWVDQLLANPSNAATERGTRLHRSLEAQVRAGSGEGHDILAGLGLQYEATEQFVWHPDLKYAGTVDVIARDSEGALRVLDWKTGKAIYVSNIIQVAAYTEALKAITSEKVGTPLIVHLGDKTKTHAYTERETERAFNCFKAAIEMADNLGMLKKLTGVL